MEVVAPHQRRSAADWAELLVELEKLVGTGRIYDRDLPIVVAAVRLLIGTLNRRVGAR